MHQGVRWRCTWAWCLLADKNMTRAEACRVTRLNKGNFYAFLKGDTSKMSRKTAMNAYREIAAL